MVCYEQSDLAKAEAQPTPPDPGPDFDSFTVPIRTNPPPADAAAAAPNDGEMHPMIRIIQERELGKVLLATAIAIVGIVVAGKDRLAQSESCIVLIMVCLGFTSILYGILLKDTLPKFAQIVETLGIALVAVSFFAIVAFFMPVGFLWVPALCIALLCLLPFIVRVWPSATG